ncbi:MAG: hypothetical protein GX889_13215 [Clostridiales bacterium]|nr:hypothetical protein [Clostridiales bacterium]
MGSIARDVLKHSLIQILEYENNDSIYNTELELKNLITSDFFKSLNISKSELTEMIIRYKEMLNLNNVDLNKIFNYINMYSLDE